MMDVIYTAETTDGNVYFVHGIKGGGSRRPPRGFSRQEFADTLILHLRTSPQDEATPRDLDLFEWADLQMLGTWLRGDRPVGSWPEMARLAEFGTVRYEYVGNGEGDWFYAEKVFQVPAGN